jgi:AcrR family transcriptional regulator
MAGNGRKRGRRHPEELALAAADWVIENGLADLSLRRLAAGLGVSHRVLIYHFGSKDQLYQAILRAARERERQRTTPEGQEAITNLPEALRQTWKYLSAPREHPFWRFYFEIHGLALQNPERYPDVLHAGVHDWLATIREPLVRDGAGKREADAVATLVLAAFRGLILDLLQTGERARVERALELLASIADQVAAPAEGKARKRRA